jgi:hypothetical protein
MLLEAAFYSLYRIPTKWRRRLPIGWPTALRILARFALRMSWRYSSHCLHAAVC